MTRELPLFTCLLVYFARNPDEALTAEDICLKYGERANVHGSLRVHVQSGMLTKTRGPSGRRTGGPMVLYGAGPKLRPLLEPRA